MRVIEVERFGGPEVLVAAEAPDPVAGPGQVIVEVAAADVLFLDTMIRGGRATAFFDQRPPYVPGNGVAGRVAATGPGVDAGWAGRAVIAHTGERGGNGGYAERAAVPVDALSRCRTGSARARRRPSCTTAPPRWGSSRPRRYARSSRC